MLDNFEKAETLSSLGPETGRTIGRPRSRHPLQPRAHHGAAGVLTADEVREYAKASDLPLTESEYTDVERLWSRNFDHEDRYVMPLKSSV
jgi:hypothetical protein